jgi:hypothetical protein
MGRLKNLHVENVCLVERRYDTQRKDIQHNDTQFINTQHNDTQFINTQHNDTQHNDTEDEGLIRDTQHKRHSA